MLPLVYDGIRGIVYSFLCHVNAMVVYIGKKGCIIVCINPLNGIMVELQFKFMPMVCRGMIEKPNSMEESGEWLF